MEEKLTVPAFAFELKQAGTRQPAQGSDHGEGGWHRDRERERRLLARLLRCGRARLDQQLARGQDVAHEGRQRQQVHIPVFLERLRSSSGPRTNKGSVRNDSFLRIWRMIEWPCRGPSATR